MIIWTTYPEGDARRPGTALYVGQEVPEKWNGKRLLVAWALMGACSIGFWIGFVYSVSRLHSLIAGVSR